jgi:hypothetical protein
VPYSLSSLLPQSYVWTSTSDTTVQMWFTAGAPVGPPTAASSSSSVSSSSLPPAATTPVQYGYVTDPTQNAASPYVDGMTAYDLHCNKPLTFSNMPAAGAAFDSFQLYYDSTSVGTGGPVVRMALYQVVGGVFSLVLGTQNGSDLVFPSGTSTQAVSSSSGPFQYGSDFSFPVVLMPTTSYAICLTNDALDIDSTLNMCDSQHTVAVQSGPPRRL